MPLNLQRLDEFEQLGKEAPLPRSNLNLDALATFEKQAAKPTIDLFGLLGQPAVATDYTPNYNIPGPPKEQPQTIVSQPYIPEAEPERTPATPPEKPRQYSGFIPELGRSLAGGTLNVASGVLGTLAQASESAIWDKDEIEQAAQSLHKKAQSPAFAPATGGGWKGFVANAVGNALPYMAAAVGSTVVTGTPLAAFGTGFAVEGDNAYRAAMERGATQDEANTERFVVGTINGAIEQLQVGRVFKLGRAGTQALAQIAKDKTLKRLGKVAGKMGVAAIRTAVEEGLEEALQESVSMAAPAMHGGKVPGPKEFGKRAGQAALGGAVAGVVLGGGGAVASRIGQKQTPVLGEGGLPGQTQKEPVGKEYPKEKPPILGEGGLPETPANIAKGEGQLRPAEEAKRPLSVSQAAPERGTEKPVQDLTPEQIARGEALVAKVGKQIEAKRATKTPSVKLEPRPPEQTVTEKTPPIQSKVSETVETDFTKATSAKQASLAEDRKSMGLDEINSKSRRSWETALKKAKGDNLPSKANRIAEEVNTSPRPLTDIETAGVTIRMAELKNEHKEAMEAVAKATDDGDIKTKSAEIQRIETEFDALTRAVHVSGTEKGRALAAQKLTINKDFSLISVLNRAKVAAGKKLTQVQQKLFGGLTEKLGNLTKRTEVLEQEITGLKAKGIVRKGVSRLRSLSVQQKNVELDSLVEKAGRLLKEGCNN